MAKEFAAAIETKFPRLWSALTNGTCVNRTIVGDGAPVVPKTVEELQKYPQFKHTHYHYDHGHDHNMTVKHTVKQGTTLSGQVETLLKVNSTLANHSNVISKLILDGRNKDIAACDEHYKEFFNNPLTEGGEPRGFKQYEALQALNPTRFCGRDKFFDSQAYLLPVLVGMYKNLMYDTDHGATAIGMLRSSCDPEFNFQFMYCSRFFRSSAVCNLRFQGRDLSKNAVIEAYKNWQKDIEEIKSNFANMLAQAKTLSKNNYKIAGQCWIAAPHVWYSAVNDNGQFEGR